MKRYLLAALATMMLVACSPGAIISTPSPSHFAELTITDERAAIGAEASYLAANLIGTMLVRSGSIDKARFKALDARAFHALSLVRAAYAAGNAAGFREAIAQSDLAIAALQTLVGE